jgi:oligopeptide/dipeptide ABC transporter ATP-binding protein
MNAPDSALLSVRDLVITNTKTVPPTTLVNGVSFTIDKGDALGLVGESGSGKSLTLRAVLGLLPPGLEVSAGQILFEGRDLVGLKPRQLRTLRGSRIGTVFQDPMTALNPVMTVGDQIAEGPMVHLGLSRSAASELAIDLMGQVGIAEPKRRARAYPYEFSGGMRQRVMIAIALACSPALLLCDEPTTALDVTIQDQILRILDGLRETNGLSLLFVTHDLAVIAQLCERVAVMYAGQIAEAGTTDDVFRRPQHGYTLGLLRSAPDLHIRQQRLVSISGLPPEAGAASCGCSFSPRCNYADDSCRQDRRYPLRLTSSGHESACVHNDQVLADALRQPVIADV